jgi:glycosyltransferase involved in cell wall biosynthesis
MDSKIDIVIPTRNRGGLIVNALESLQENHSQDFYVWIVDQSENSLTAEAVKPFLEKDSRYSLITSHTKGADIARNIGLQVGQSSIIAFLDDDCRVADTWVEILLNEYEANPEVASIFGRVIPKEGPMEFSNKKETAVMQRLHQVLPMAKKVEQEHRFYTQNNCFDLGFGHGANMSFRRSTFAEIGVFDEYLGGGAPLKSWEERDIGYRILRNGGTILYSPDLIVYHEHWRGWHDVCKAFQEYAFGAGAATGKYVRTGDWASLRLLGDWLLQMGIRQILSGLIKWRSWQKIYVGIMQLIYPWIGLWQSRQYAIDPHYCVYIRKKGKTQKVPTIEPPSSKRE